MTKILDVLLQDHRHFLKLLDLLDKQIAVIERGEEPSLTLLTDILEYYRHYPDGWHHTKEDLILDKLREREPQACVEFEQFRDEHNELRTLAGDLVTAVQKYNSHQEQTRHNLAKRLREFVELFRNHIVGEEAEFFTMAEQSLLVEDWVDIELTLGGPDDPIFGKTASDRYKTLLAQIMKSESGTAG